MSLWPSLGLELWGMEIKVNHRFEPKPPPDAGIIDIWRWRVAFLDVPEREPASEIVGCFLRREIEQRADLRAADMPGA